MSKRDPLLEYLADNDAACPQCNYNLRGLTTNRCPECGEFVELRLSLADPKMYAYLATLIATALGMGGSCLFIGLASVAAPGGPLWLLEEVSGWLLVLQLLITLVALPVLLIGRKWFRRVPMVGRILIAVTMWCTVLALSALIILLFND